MLHIMPTKNFYLSKKNPHDIHLDFNLIYESYIAFANGHNHPALQNKSIVHVDDLIFILGCGIYYKIHFVC